MTIIRSPVSAEQNIWSDSQQVDDTDLTLEQNYNDTINSALVSNHVGTGAIPTVLTQNILFDSSLFSSTLNNGFLDGIAISTQNQPSDKNFGNQLEIILTGSIATVKKAVKICVIGLDFQSNLQYETFYLKTNESQVGSKHFTEILTILFNDFVGDPNLSFNLGGRIVIQEAGPMTLSRDPIMVSQDIQPNLFFRDFFVNGLGTLQGLLQNALPLYNINNLNINTQPLDNLVLSSGDVTTQVGQKFIATTDNIQKVTLLLSVRNQNGNDLTWTGDLVISIYPLQSSIECSTDLAPTSPLDFSPSNIPLAQASFNYISLQTNGTVLDSVPQPVDFVFSNSSVASGNIIIPNNYYVVTIKRSGAANSCDILIAAGAATVENSRATTFSGNLWVDLASEDLWFRIWSDSAKVSDGQAYESGHGIAIPKTTQDPTTLENIDYSLNNLSFYGNDIFNAVVASGTQESTPIPDQRTGNPVLSRKQFVPQVSLLDTVDLTSLETSTNPFIVGAISDQNRKYLDTSSLVASLVRSNLYSASLVGNQMFIRVVDDSSDGYRFDTSVSSLVSSLLNGDLVGAKINPNANNTSVYYRIASAQLASMIVGDVDGNGIVDDNDVTLQATYTGFNFNVGLPKNTVITSVGNTTSFANGYNTLTVPFVNLTNISFQLVDPNNNYNVVAFASDGVLVANLAEPNSAQFTSSTIAFNTIVGLSDYQIVLLTPSVPGNYGGFTISSLDSVVDVITITKIFLDGNSIGQMLRSDIDGDFTITANDGYLLSSYVDRLPVSTSGPTTFPSPATNPYSKIGTKFNVIILELEEFIDRADDYSPVTVGRSTTIHPSPDIYLSDGYFTSHQYIDLTVGVAYPVPISIQKQLVWDESLIVTSSSSKLVPSVFPTLTGFNDFPCTLGGIIYSMFPQPPQFDPGRVDFFIPNNLIIGTGGELQTPSGSFYKVDFEVGTIVLEIPDGLFGSEKTIDILNNFIASTTNAGVPTGVTVLGFPAMQFADCSFVTANALDKDQLRFSVSVQSFSPNTSGLSDDGYGGVIVDGKMGVSVDYATGLLTLNFTNLFEDAVLQTLSTKIQINVFLKQGGFNNAPIFIDSTKVQNMLSLTSIFSGAVSGGPSALVDLLQDVSGALPVLNGGTGLNEVGAVGTVLTSNGTGLSYQFIYDIVGAISYSQGISSANSIPKTDGYGLLDPSFLYKNPVYIYGQAGIASSSSNSPTVIGALTFRFDKFILEGIQDIRVEAILESTNVLNAAQIRLFNVSTNSYLTLSGGNPYISQTLNFANLTRSDDIKSQLTAGAQDVVYEVHLSLTTSSPDVATCKMARLVITYNNPASLPPAGNSANFVPYLP